MVQRTAIENEKKRRDAAYKAALKRGDPESLQYLFALDEISILEQSFGGYPGSVETYLRFEVGVRRNAKALSLSFDDLYEMASGDEAVARVPLMVVGAVTPYARGLRQTIKGGTARAIIAYNNSILSSERGAIGPVVTNKPKAARRDERGRFITDPENPPSPYVYTDAQRRAAWKKLAEDPMSPLTADERAEIKARGWRGPQRYNEYGELETMELSHEPVPLREGGTEVVPRWPSEHAQVDPFRRLKKR